MFSLISSPNLSTLYYDFTLFHPLLFRFSFTFSPFLDLPGQSIPSSPPSFHTLRTLSLPPPLFLHPTFILFSLYECIATLFPSYRILSFFLIFLFSSYFSFLVSIFKCLRKGLPLLFLLLFTPSLLYIIYPFSSFFRLPFPSFPTFFSCSLSLTYFLPPSFAFFLMFHLLPLFLRILFYPHFCIMLHLTLPSSL